MSETEQTGWSLDGDRIVFRAPCARACGEYLEGSIGIDEALSALAGGREPPRGVVVAVKQALRVAEVDQNPGDGMDLSDLPVDGGLVCPECLAKPVADYSEGVTASPAGEEVDRG